MLHCLHEHCQCVTDRQYDLDCHQDIHSLPRPREKHNCTVRGCGRTGESGYVRKCNLLKHMWKVHGIDIPKDSKSGPEPPGDIGSYNANSEAPIELKAQVENNNEVPPPPYYSRSLKPVGFPKSTTVKLPKTTMLGSPSYVERPRLLRSQSPYVAEISLGTASGVKKSISHDMSENDKASPSSTSLESVRNVQVASEHIITHGRPRSQSVELGYEHNEFNPNKIDRRPSNVSADIERSTMTTTGERGVQDTEEPEKLALEPDNKVRASILDRSVHSMPLTLIEANGGIMNSLSDDGYEHLQDGDDISSIDGPLCFHLACVYCLIDQADANL